MPIRVRRLDAAAVFLISEGLTGFIRAMVYTVVAVYYVVEAGLDPLRLVLVGTVLEASTALFEIPTGVIADVFSRRLSILLGHLLWGVAFVVEGSVPVFGVILIVEVVRAVGETCLSGASEAWLADEVGEGRVGPLFLRAALVRRACWLVGIGASVGLASVNFSLPIVVGGLLSIGLAGFLLLAMPEHGFRPVARTSWLDGVRQTASNGIGQVWRRPLLLVFLGVAAASGASSEGYDRLWEAHFLAAFTFPGLGALEPVVWFGILQAVALVLGIVAVQWMRRLALHDDRTLARWLIVTNSVWIIAVIVFGLAPDFTVAALAYWVASAMRTAGQPLMSSWVVRSIPPQVRATVLSTLSQGDAIGQMLGGPVVGAIGSASSLRAAMVATAVLHAPKLLLLGWARRLSQAPHAASGPPTETEPSSRARSGAA
jgi:DHA3 family tetracycline resistance protein-like MFS transporter